MADAVAHNDVKSGVAATSATTGQPEAGKTPATEDVVPASKVDNKVPYDRFQEVIQQKNEYAARLEELERRLQVNEVAIGAKNKIDVTQKHVEKLVAAGMDRGAAEILIEATAGMTDEKIGNRVSPLEQKSLVQEAMAWTQAFARTHPDYDALQPKMYETFKALPEQTQNLVSSDPKGLEMLYSYVKMQNLPQIVEQSQKAATETAYDTKGLKQAMSSQPGASTSPNLGFTRKQVEEMSLADYAKNKKQIFEQMVQKKQLYQ